MPFPILPVLGGMLAGTLLGGGRGRGGGPKTVSSLSPEQQTIAGQMQPRLSQRLGYSSGASANGGGGQPFGAQLEAPAIAALQRALAVDPRFAATYGMMGLRAIQTSTAAVPHAQQIWQEPYRMGLEFLRTPMTNTYMEQPAPNPFMQLLGMALPSLLGKFL